MPAPPTLRSLDGSGHGLLQLWLYSNTLHGGVRINTITIGSPRHCVPAGRHLQA